MNAGRDVERLIADWFVEEAVLRAPDRVLEETGRAIDQLQRRRLGVAWRSIRMSAPLRLAAAAVLGVLVVGGAFLVFRPTSSVVGDPATPSPSMDSPAAPSSVALTKSYNSGRHGYRVSYPDNWTVLPATQSWLPDTRTLWGDPALDSIEGPDGRLVAASQPLAPGQSPEAWYTAYCVVNNSADACPSTQASWTPISIGPESGYLTIDGEKALPGSIKPGAPFYDAVVVVDGRGYEFTLDGDVDRALLEQLLGSVAFSAGKATPLDNVTDTFESPLYGYSIRVDPGWTIEPATVSADDSNATPENAEDRIRPADTDSTISVVANSLDGKTFDETLATIHEGVLGDAGVPASCKNGEPDTWPAFPVGGRDGRLMTLCNFAQVFVDGGDRVYTFTWGNDTFDTSQHLDVVYFEELLSTATFQGS